MEKGKTQVLNKEETSNDFEEDEIKDKFGEASIQLSDEESLQLLNRLSLYEPPSIFHELREKEKDLEAKEKKKKKSPYDNIYDDKEESTDSSAIKIIIEKKEGSNGAKKDESKPQPSIQDILNQRANLVKQQQLQRIKELKEESLKNLNDDTSSVTSSDEEKEEDRHFSSLSHSNQNSLRLNEEDKRASKRISNYGKKEFPSLQRKTLHNQGSFREDLSNSNARPSMEGENVLTKGSKKINTERNFDRIRPKNRRSDRILASGIANSTFAFVSPTSSLVSPSSNLGTSSPSSNVVTPNSSLSSFNTATPSSSSPTSSNSEIVSSGPTRLRSLTTNNVSQIGRNRTDSLRKKEELPPGWEARQTSEGDLYYFDHITGSTTTDREQILSIRPRSQTILEETPPSIPLSTRSQKKAILSVTSKIENETKKLQKVRQFEWENAMTRFQKMNLGTLAEKMKDFKLEQEQQFKQFAKELKSGANKAVKEFRLQCLAQQSTEAKTQKVLMRTRSHFSEQSTYSTPSSVSKKHLSFAYRTKYLDFKHKKEQELLFIQQQKRWEQLAAFHARHLELYLGVVVDWFRNLSEKLESFRQEQYLIDQNEVRKLTLVQDADLTSLLNQCKDEYDTFERDLSEEEKMELKAYLKLEKERKREQARERKKATSATFNKKAMREYHAQINQDSYIQFLQEQQTKRQQRTAEIRQNLTMREQARLDLHQMQSVELVQNLFRHQLLILREDSKQSHKHLRKIYSYSKSFLATQQEERERLADENLKLKLEQLRDQLSIRQKELEEHYKKLIDQLSEGEEKSPPSTNTAEYSSGSMISINNVNNNSNISPRTKLQRIGSSDNVGSKKLKENQEREFLRARNELEKQILSLKRTIVQNQHEQELAILDQNFYEKHYLEEQLFRLFKMQLEQTADTRLKIALHYSEYLSSCFSSPSEEDARLEMLQTQHTKYQSTLDKEQEEQKELMKKRHFEQMQQLEKEIQTTNVWHEEEELRLWNMRQPGFEMDEKTDGKRDSKRDSKKLSKKERSIKKSDGNESLSHAFYMFILDGEL